MALVQDDDPDPYRALGDFAHEVRNPLNALYGYSQLLSQLPIQGEEGEKVQEYAAVINLAVKQALSVCERVLSEAIDETPVDRRGPVDASAMADEVAALFAEEAKLKGVQLKTNFPANFPKIISDPTLLRQFLLNIVGNSIKYTPRGGKVEIRGELTPDSNAMILVVQDSGKGVPADIIRRLRRGEAVIPARPKNDSFGRGLRISAEIASRLDSQLEIFPAPDGGTICVLRQQLSRGQDAGGASRPHG